MHPVQYYSLSSTPNNNMPCLLMPALSLCDLHKQLDCVLAVQTRVTCCWCDSVQQPSHLGIHSRRPHSLGGSMPRQQWLQVAVFSISALVAGCSVQVSHWHASMLLLHVRLQQCLMRTLPLQPAGQCNCKRIVFIWIVTRVHILHGSKAEGSQITPWHLLGCAAARIGLLQAHVHEIQNNAPLKADLMHTLQQFL